MIVLNRRRSAALIVVSALAFAGCKSRSTPSHVGMGGDPYGKTVASWVLWGNKTAIIVWSDAQFYQGGGLSDNGELLTVHERATHSLFDGTYLEWDLSTRDGRSGQVTINGVTYELSDGCLFLVSTKGGVIRVVQLGRDWIQEYPAEEAAKRLAKSDTEVIRFIAAADQAELNCEAILSIDGFSSLLPLLHRPRPVIFEQARERPIREQLATGLTSGAVVRFILGVHNALDGRAADWAWLAKPSVGCHTIAEGGHLLRKAVGRVTPQVVEPVLQCRACGRKQACNFFVL